MVSYYEDNLTIYRYNHHCFHELFSHQHELFQYGGPGEEKEEDGDDDDDDDYEDIK